VTDVPRAAIVVVTHGESGAAMVAAVRELLGVDAVEDFFALTIGHHEDREHTLDRLVRVVRDADRGGGVLLLCDLHGATPTNCAAQLEAEGTHAAVVTGVNLPMLIKLASSERRGVAIRELAQMAIDTAMKSIHRVGGK